MSVYTTPQPQLGQQPYGFGQLGQAPYGQQPAQAQQLPGMQQGQMVQQPSWQPQFGMQMMPAAQAGQMGIERILPQLVAHMALSCAAAAVDAVVEQLRTAPQALFGIQAQGQIPAHLYSSVLTECARRVAPVLHTAVAPVLQAQIGQIGQIAGQAWGQQFGQQPWGAQSPAGMPQFSAAGFPGGYGI